MAKIQPKRRQLVQFFGAASAMLSLSPSSFGQQSYPSKPITLIVGFPAGGATDIQARALASAAAKELGQPIIILNRPGLSATLGPSFMAESAAPDGYTIAVMPATLFRLPHLQKVSFDPLKDFTYISNITNYTFGITVPQDSPWKTLQDLLDHAKANPGKLSYGTTGVGGTAHVSMERLAKAAGVKFNFVPFKGAAEVYPAVLGGHINFSPEAGFGSYVDSGKLRLLGTFSEARLKKRDNVPTMKELGYDIVARSTWGIGGPKGMNPKVVQALDNAFHKAMDDPEFKRILLQQDQPASYLNSKDFTAYAAEQTAEEKRFMSELGIKLE